MSIFSYKEKPGYFSRLKEALKATQRDLSHKISQLTGSEKSPIRPEQLEELEEVLLAADIGVQTTGEIIGRIQQETRGSQFVTSQQVRRLIRSELLSILTGSGGDSVPEGQDERPRVVFVVGVNGVGKTTTIAKLASLYMSEGRSVLYCASDTFRAAAIEQIAIWAERTGCDIIRQAQGADPAAVLFDALAAARARGTDVVIVDTAGRIHTKANLMQELDKMHRVAAREISGAPHDVLLVLDATTGQNGLVQAREFLKVAGVTGLVVTKLDGTAKGGIVVSIAKEMAIPIQFVGVGEKLDDLLVFDPVAYVDSLLGAE